MANTGRLVERGFFKPWRALLLACGLCVGLPAAAQNTREPDWVRDMPSAAKVLRQIQGSNTAQTLGRQCAALTRFTRGFDLPSAYLYRPTPGMRALDGSYREALNQLQQRYSSTVKPLNVTANQQEWNRMCANARSGFHPVTGAADRNYPALEQPVTEAEWVALLGPAAVRAYEAERISRAELRAKDQAAAASAAERQQRRQAQERMDQLLLIGLMGGGVVAFGLFLVAMVWMWWGTRWKPGPGPDQLQLRSALWEVDEVSGLVLACRKDSETVITGGGSGGVNNQPVTVSISSHTRTHWDVRLSRPDGREEDIRLRDWDISVHAGDVLQCYRLRRGARRSDFVMVHNRQTGQYWHQVEFIYRRLRPLHTVVALLLVLLLGLATMGAAWVVGGLWMWLTFRRATKAAGEVTAWLAQRPAPQPMSGFTQA